MVRLAPSFRSVSASLEREGPARRGPHDVPGGHGPPRALRTRESTAQTRPVGRPVGPLRFRAPTAAGPVRCALPTHLTTSCVPVFPPVSRRRISGAIPSRAAASGRATAPAPASHGTVSRPQVLENPIRSLGSSRKCCAICSRTKTSCRVVAILLASISSRARTQIRKSNDRSTEKTTLPSSPAHAGSACIAWSPATARTVEASQPNLARRFPTRDATEAGVGSASPLSGHRQTRWNSRVHRFALQSTTINWSRRSKNIPPRPCYVCRVHLLETKIGSVAAAAVHCHPGFEMDTIWKLSLKIRLCSLYKVQTPLRQAQQPDTPAHRAGLRHRQKYE